MTEPFASGKVRLIRRNPWILGLAASPILLSVAAIVAAITVKVGFLAVAFHPLILAAVALAYAWNRNPYARAIPARVSADADGVTVDGRLVRRAEIRDGFVLPRSGKAPLVRLARKGPRPALEIEVRHEQHGRRLLRALGLDVSQTVANFRVSSRVVAHRSWTFAAVGALLAVGVLARVVAGTHPGAFFAAFPLFAVLVMLLALVPSKLRVGVDGVLLSWFGRKRFVPYSNVVHVTEYHEGFGRSRIYGVSIQLETGEVLKIPVSGTSWDGGRVGIIAERIREAMDTNRRGGAEADAALLRRGAREVKDWVAALRSIGTGANAAHRTAPVAPERLWRVVEDPGGEPIARAAAAVALAADLDDEGRSRLRVAAEATAAPKLRVVLEAAAAEARGTAAEAQDDDELTEALAELEGEAPVRGTS